METPTAAANALRLRAHVFEKMVNKKALQATFAPPNLFPNAFPNSDKKLSMQDVQCKAEEQIANVLSMGKLARRIAFACLAHKIVASDFEHLTNEEMMVWVRKIKEEDDVNLIDVQAETVQCAQAMLSLQKRV